MKKKARSKKSSKTRYFSSVKKKQCKGCDGNTRQWGGYCKRCQDQMRQW